MYVYVWAKSNSLPTFSIITGKKQRRVEQKVLPLLHFLFHWSEKKNNDKKIFGQKLWIREATPGLQIQWDFPVYGVKVA